MEAGAWTLISESSLDSSVVSAESFQKVRRTCRLATFLDTIVHMKTVGFNRCALYMDGSSLLTVK